MPAIKTNGLTLYSDLICAYSEDQSANARYKVFFSVKAKGPFLLLATCSSRNILYKCQLSHKVFNPQLNKY